MTQLDYQGKRPGYYPSTWAVECGGSRRQKLVGSPGLDLQAGETLSSTSRDTGGWPVMFVQREPGELFLQGGAAQGSEGTPPFYRPDRGTHADNAGWLERVDPITLETLARSPNLPTGGHVWCGAVVVHQNGDLYTANGRFCHRLNASCEVIAERELPFDGPYNGLLIMTDGNLVMKNLGHRLDEPCVFSVLEPERLEPIGDPFVIDTPCMGRFSSDLCNEGEFIYTSTATNLLRLEYEAGHLSLDSSWNASYAIAGEDQSDAWDTSIGSDSIWLMDMGRPMPWRGPAAAPQRAFRFSLADASERDVIDEIGLPNAWNPGPPLYDPERKILILYDTLNGGVVAMQYHGPGNLSLLWRKEFRNTVQMMLYADTGELVLEDSPHPFPMPEQREGHVVVVDIETGLERGRAPIGASAAMGMFLCPGFGRDFYVASGWGTVARIFVA